MANETSFKLIPYRDSYPSAAVHLINERVITEPKQYEKENLRWAEGVDIVYNLIDMTPVKFQQYSEELLLLAYQEAERYKSSKLKFAGFDVKLGKLPKGKELPDVNTFQAAMHNNSAIMVYGASELGYEVPQKHFLIDKVQDIQAIIKRYEDRVSKQTPYIVLRLFISIREPKFAFTAAGGKGGTEAQRIRDEKAKGK